LQAQGRQGQSALRQRKTFEGCASALKSMGSARVAELPARYALPAVVFKPYHMVLAGGFFCNEKKTA
jgi:hypothetical protein